MAKQDGGGFDFSAINGSMAKQLVKDMLAAFDADCTDAPPVFSDTSSSDGPSFPARSEPETTRQGDPRGQGKSRPCAPAHPNPPRARARAEARPPPAPFEPAADRRRTPQDDTDALMLKVLPLATAIASEALVRWGIEEDSEGNAFIEVMNALAKLAPADEFLSYDIYVLKCKFMPLPPTNRAPPPTKPKTRPKKPSLDDMSALSR